jgi:predicted P-loop ATPase/GTPase
MKNSGASKYHLPLWVILMIKVLIVGVLSENSGKTTLAEALISEAIEKGVDVGVSKPFCSTNGWYHYEVIVRSAEFGLLLGRDIQRLHNVARSIESVELENPVCVLAMPLDLEKLEWNLMQNLSMNQIAMIRVSGKETKHYVVNSNLERFTGILRKEVERLSKALKGEVQEIEIEDAEEILRKARDLSNEALKEIKRRHDMVVIESFSNVASPNTESLDSDIIIAVSPGKAVIYEGEKYRRAVDILLDFKDPWEITTDGVLRLLKPLRTIELKPKELGNKGILKEIFNF